MKTIRNSMFIGASLLGSCASVGTYFDALRVAYIKDAVIEKLVALILAIKLILGFRVFSS
ncbi:urease-enhancing factor [Helicobacter pylori]|uniref:urease-enhancing factor n=1 Tax=Helicobacter pylori TaxID=210 RepID=UPI0029291772|nr:urease-enhancing factor [Helicobacter pylori]MDU9777503.1 urease-enhancing factor [Helicobacter pylori]